MIHKTKILKYLNIMKEYWKQEEKDTDYGSCAEPYEQYEHGEASGKAAILEEIIQAIEDGSFDIVFPVVFKAK
jgi:hypothetical protein